MAVPVRRRTVQVNGRPEHFPEKWSPVFRRKCDHEKTRARSDLVGTRSEQVARALELLGRIDAQRHTVDDGYVDAHAGFQRAQLLEFFPLLERRGGKADEAGERLAPVGVEADVVIERAIARRRGGTGEVERAQPLRRSEEHTSELQSLRHLVCRLLLEKKKKNK